MEKPKGMLTALIMLGLIFVASCLEAGETWLTDFMTAQQESQEKKRPILAAFVGSDWCPWCQKLESEIFNQPDFKILSGTGSSCSRRISPNIKSCRRN